MALRQPRDEHLTYQNYVGWSDDQRWELIDGTEYAMSPAPGPAHQEIVARLVTRLQEFLEDKTCKVLPAPIDVLLPAGDEADERVDTVVQPDVLVVCDPAKIREKNIRGAPDLVIEVMSPSSSSRDAILKRRLYERTGVREFWLVSPSDRLVTVFRLGADGTFDKPTIYDAEGQVEVSVLPGFTLDLGRVFPPLPDEPPARPPPPLVQT